MTDDMEKAKVLGAFFALVCAGPMGPDGMHPHVLRELASVIVRPFLVMFETWQLGEVPEDWKKSNVATLFKKKDPGNYRLVSLNSTPGKVMEEHLIMEGISRHMKDKKGTRSSQHRLKKGKTWLTYLTAFCDEMTDLVDKGRAVNGVSFNFSKVFDTVYL
ncbi:hypothetical protein QYF61_025676 [Mycteria americana]|uniref:Uncharacterized protein n=1 Tax=Mycteria americana TaxID=33587 RepID=A0AAN7PWZ0_MYCAM|nr:hypothetical protein QYF61_025676 [Mycteria americana]